MEHLFSDSRTFFSHLTVPSLHYAISTSHVIIFFPHIGGSLNFFLKFDNFILILCGSNITYDSFFATLGGSLTFFTHLTVPFSHCAVPTSHVTVLFSHLVVPLLFSYICQFYPYIVQFQHHL